MKVYAVLKDYVDHREIKIAGRADDPDPRQPLEVQRQRVSNLVLDLVWAVAHPFGEDNDLILRQVGDGIDRGVINGIDTPQCQDQAGGDHEGTVADREVDDA